MTTKPSGPSSRPVPATSPGGAARFHEAARHRRSRARTTRYRRPDGHARPPPFRTGGRATAARTGMHGPRPFRSRADAPCCPAGKNAAQDATRRVASAPHGQAGQRCSPSRSSTNEHARRPRTGLTDCARLGVSQTSRRSIDSRHSRRKNGAPSRSTSRWTVRWNASASLVWVERARISVANAWSCQR